MHDVFIHPTAMIDEGAKIGAKCTIWHFSHIMSGASLGDSCNIGQNVMVAPRVIIGNNVKIQNNVSVYEGVVDARLSAKESRLVQTLLSCVVSKSASTPS